MSSPQPTQIEGDTILCTEIINLNCIPFVQVHDTAVTRGSRLHTRVGYARVDPNKPHAIQQMKAPSNIAKLRIFLGMMTYLGKFASNLSHKVKPLRDLLSAKNEWTWSDGQQNAFS